MTASSSPKTTTKRVKKLEAFGGHDPLFLAAILVVGLILAYLLHMPAAGENPKPGDLGTIAGVRIEDKRQVVIPFHKEMLKDIYVQPSLETIDDLATVNIFTKTDKFTIYLPPDQFIPGAPPVDPAKYVMQLSGVVTLLSNNVDIAARPMNVAITADMFKQLPLDAKDSVTLTTRNNLVITLPYAGKRSNAMNISEAMPPSVAFALLWILELGLYVGLTWYITRHPIIATVALGLGLVMRYAFVVIYQLVFGIMDGTPFLANIAMAESRDWAYQLLNLAVISGLFALPLRNFLKTGFNYKINPEIDDSNTVKSSSVSTPVAANKFSFAPKQAQVADIKIRKAPKPAASAEQGVLNPPEDFIRSEPVKGVHGTVNIPRKVIIASVPEAENILRTDKPIPVQLAFVVPQLKRATVWLTWQQIFDTGNTDPAHGNPNMEDPDLYDRWIRIPAKYYALQVPEQLYAKGQVNHPAWMLQPHVPQEEQYDLEQEHV